MSITRTILIKSLAKTFYRQNAGLLAFVLFMLVVAVGRANEAGLLEYHYELIRGMMINPVLFILVLIIWFIYAKKCEQFISQTIRRQDFSFLQILSVTDAGKLYASLLTVQLLIYSPVLAYVLVIAGVGIHQHWYIQVALLLLYNLVLCLISAGWYAYLLKHPGSNPFTARWKLPTLRLHRYYWYYFIRYILADRKVLLLAVKLYSCGMLYLMVSRQLTAVYDLSMILLFYSFGLLGHSVIIHQCRELEETRLAFYRGLPVTLSRRLLQYGILYLLLFIPEIVTISWLTPAFLHAGDALLLVFLGYSVLLLLNSILFIRSFAIKSYLKIMVLLFFIIFLGILTKNLFWLAALFLLWAIYIFFSRYYRYERSAG